MDIGIHVNHVLSVGVPLPQAKYRTIDQRTRFAQELLERSAALPGVEAATFGLPFGGLQSPFTIVGQLSDDSKRIGINLVGAGHLSTFGIPLRGGRMFDGSEVRRGDRVAVINEAAVKLWPAGQNPIGARLRLGLLERPPPRALAGPRPPPQGPILRVLAHNRNAGVRSPP